MSNVVAYPLAAPAGRVRVWVGVCGVQRAPRVAVKLSGSRTRAKALRPLASVRTSDLLQGVDAGAGRAFTGVYEFKAPVGSASVTVTAAGQTVEVPVASLPAELPDRADQPFNVLLCSCYDQDEDRSGLLSTLVSQLPVQPSLALFLGDQVYLDLPTLEDFPPEAAKLAQKFEDKYVSNWMFDHTGLPGLSGVLARAGSAFVPDDHEYWNNFPHAAVVVQNSWTQAGRDSWKAAARAVYQGFQLAPDATFGGASVLDVPPLSFFLLDARSERQEDRAYAIPPQTQTQFNAWIDALVASKSTGTPRFGVLVSGQPLLDPAAGKLRGSIADYHWADYGDFGVVTSAIERLAAAGQSLLYVTGDVHYGRVCAATDLASGRDALYEVICSPSSLVTMPGVDPLKQLGGALGGLFGRKDPWPRHAKPEPPPARFGTARPLQPRMLHGQKGDHVAVLSFWRAGGGVDFAVTYYPIHPDKAQQQPVRLDGFKLRAF